MSDSLGFQEDVLALRYKKWKCTKHAFIYIRPPEMAKLLKRLFYLFSFQNQIKGQLIIISNTQVCLKSVLVDGF